VGVAEDQARRGDAVQQLGLVVGRLRQKRADVRSRRAVADQRGPVDRAEGQAGEVGDELVAEGLAGGGDRSGQDRVGGRGAGRRRPALAVAADPQRGQLAQALDRLQRPAAEERVVAAEDEAVDVAGVLEHRLERREVAVHVVDQRLHRPCIASEP
jgi:hypothetical protein